MYDMDHATNFKDHLAWIWHIDCISLQVSEFGDHSVVGCAFSFGCCPFVFTCTGNKRDSSPMIKMGLPFSP